MSFEDKLGSPPPITSEKIKVKIRDGGERETPKVVRQRHGLGETMTDSLAIFGAFNTLKEAMEDDPSTPGSYAHSWHSELAGIIAEILNDEFGDDLDDPVFARMGNRAAAAFMKSVFGVDTSGVGKDENNRQASPEVHGE